MHFWTSAQVNTVVYVGDSRSREVIRAYEFDIEGGGKGAGSRKQFEVGSCGLSSPRSARHGW